MDKIQLKNQEVEVTKCDTCGRKMVNVDASQLAPGDLTTLKKAGVSISNPDTTDNICVSCEYKPTLGHRLAKFFGTDSDEDSDDDSSDDDSDDDDSSFFGGYSSGDDDDSSSSIGGGSFGGFGGFGGGGFSGGGASGSF